MQVTVGSGIGGVVDEAYPAPANHCKEARQAKSG